MDIARRILYSIAWGCAIGPAAAAEPEVAGLGVAGDTLRARVLGRPIGAVGRQLAEPANGSPSLVAVFDAELRYLGASEAWVKRYFPTGASWIGRHHHDLVPDLPERYRDAHRRALAGESFHGVQDHFLRADGTTHWVSWSCSPWWTEDGRIGGITLSVHDVSEVREKEMELQEKIRTTDRMASIGMLGAGLGHDMQNLLLPLRAHLNAARRLGDAAGGCGQDAHFEALRRGIEHLQHLADSLHLLACDESASEIGSCDGTALASWWDQFEPLFRCTMPRRTRLDVAIGPELPRVRVSGHILTRAMLNLLTNAARAVGARIDRLPRGGVVTVAVTGESDARGDWVRIAVRDNGVGMTPEVRRRATEAFFTTRNGGKGSGLGLSFVARVVEECGGRLEIESEPEVGTTMSMVLPAASGR